MAANLRWIIALAAWMILPAIICPAGYTDSKGTWGEEQLARLQAEGIFSGSKISGSMPISRAEFVAALARAKGWTTGYRASFPDVRELDWYAPYMAALCWKSPFGSSDPERFAPKGNITMAEAMAILVRTQLSPGKIDAYQAPLELLAEYPDAKEAPVWSLKYLAAAVREGLYPARGDLGSLQPNRVMTHAEAAVALAHLLPASAASTPAPEPAKFAAGSNAGRIAALLAAAGISARSVSEIPEETKKAAPPVQQGPFTGLVVDARGLGLCRSMSPRIVNEQCAAEYESGIRDPKVLSRNTCYGCFPKMPDKELDFVIEHGIVSYAHEINDPELRNRVGSNPLIIRALRATHVSRSWAVVSLEDAARIEKAEAEAPFKAKYKVGILLDQ